MRISRKRVENICEILSTKNQKYRLVYHQNLGNRKEYYYTYSIVIDEPSYSRINFKTYTIETVNYITGYNYKETILANVTLREAYNFVIDIMNKNI